MFGNAIRIGNGSSFSVNLSVESADSTEVTLTPPSETLLEAQCSQASLRILRQGGTLRVAMTRQLISHLPFSESSSIGNFTSTLTIGNAGVEPEFTL